MVAIVFGHEIHIFIPKIAIYSSKKILLASLMAFEDVSFCHNLKIKDDK